MTDTFTLKRHDTRPHLDVNLQEGGEYIDLTATSGVTFTMIDADDKTIKVNASSCSIVDAETGAVRYSWVPADTDTAGVYLGEFQVTYSNGDKMTVPVSEVLVVVILEDYDNA